MSLKKQAGVWKWFSVDVRDIPHRDFTGTCSTASSTPPAPHLSIRESPAFRNVFPNLALGISTCFLQPGCKDRKVPAIFFKTCFLKEETTERLFSSMMNMFVLLKCTLESSLCVRALRV